MALRRLFITPGYRFGQLSVLKELPKEINKRMFLCKCDCGNKCAVRLEYLRSSHTTSCGCKRVTLPAADKRTHGMTGTRIYRIWSGMKKRCYNPNVKSYKDYGAKGVAVCEEWMEFEPFRDWSMKNGYREHLTIDRKNPYGNYEPSNCQWITKQEQGKNRRKSVRITS